VLGAVLALFPACRTHPAAGEKCRVPGQLLCEGRDRAVVCDPDANGSTNRTNGGANGGVWADVPCRGPRGCGRLSNSGNTASADECDDTVASENDACPRNPALDYACTADHSKALVCKEARFALWRNCRGPAGCEIVDGRNVHCDTSAGEAGDPCEKQGTYACSVDAKAMLVCSGSALTPASSCGGPGACSINRDTHKVDCDDTMADVGDPCDEPRRITCAPDHKAELVCVSAQDGGAPGKYAKRRDCKRTDCRIGGSKLFCD
jgi:hypothetical protein